jgi:PAS domain S-box-containing protein
MTKKTKIISTSFLFAILFGVADAWLDSVFFYEESFLDLLIFAVPWNEVFSRTLTLVVMLLFGLLVANYYEKMAVASDKERTASEAELNKLIDSTSAVPWKLDIATQKFVFMGKRITSLTGYKPPELLDFDSWASKIHPDDREFAVDFCRTATKKTADHELVYRMTTAAGETIWIRDLVFIEKKDDKAIFLKGFFFDISKAMEAEAENKQLEAQLRQAQKMEALGQLAGGVAHDFNNFLTTIVGYGELSLMNMADGDPNHENITEILSAANKAASVTRSLLAFSRKQVLNPKPVNINEVINGMEKLLGRILGENIALAIKTSRERIIVRADSGQLEQVVMNMAANSSAAIKNNGVFTIEIYTSFIDEKASIAYGLAQAGEYACILFSDDGEGMNDATLEKIFEPFYTTKDKDHGTGLGLSIVHGIVKQHHGYIRGYSKKGHGTTFQILLPCTEPSRHEKPQPNAYKIKGGNETILIAEDEESVRKLLSEILSTYGYNIIMAKDGHDAVHKFQAVGNKIELVILDVIMPGQNGKEVLAEIHRESPEAKVLFISGYSPDIIQHKGLIIKDTPFLAKPILPNELLHRVREILDGNSRTAPRGDNPKQAAQQ